MTPEEAVIGACLLDERVIRFATEHVMPTDFSTWQGEEIFSAICWLHAAKQPVDVVTVAARLAEMGSKVVATELHRVMATVPTAQNVGFYAAEVREASTRRRLRAVSMRLMQGAENEAVPPGETLAAVLDELKAARDDAPTSNMPATYVEDLMAVKDSYDWIIPGLFERGDRFVLTGPPGKGKTTLCRQMVVFAAAGIHPFFLRPIDPVKVLVVDRENSERQWRRGARVLYEQAKAIGKGRPQDIRIHCEPRPMDITRDKDLGMVHRLVDEVEPDLIYIGPLYKMSPVAIQTDSEATPVLAALDSLRDRGCALLIEAHAGKATELAPRGSAALMGWPEFGRGLRQSIDNPEKFYLEEWRGDRDARDVPAELLRGGPVPWLSPDVPDVVVQRFWNWRTPTQGAVSF